MMNLRPLRNRFCMWRTLPAVAVLAFCSIAAPGANNIAGSVRNETRGEPATGDEVLLIRLGLDKGMREAQAKTDAHGAFTLGVQYPDQPYLVREVHQGISYDQRALVGDALTIQVFDTALQVPGVTGTIEIIRAATKGSLLHVSDLVEIKNESSPPLTQASERTFEAYLPANAKIDSVLAAGPGKISEIISAAPVPGEPGHFTVNFPLRPGATKFAFNYDLPYHGHAAFRIRHKYPLQQFAVMIPPTMKFSSRSLAFEVLAAGDTDYKVHAATQVKAGEGPAFDVYGTGVLPSIQGQAKSQAHAPSPPNPTRSAQVRVALPSSPPAPSGSVQPQLSSQSSVLGALTAILLAACVVLIWRTRKARRITAK
jgi:hypothetical protein